MHVACCESLLASSCHASAVLHFAKADMLTKNDSLKAVMGKYRLLQDVVEADKVHMSNRLW